MKIEHRPFACGFLAGLLVLLLAAIATCVGCASGTRPVTGLPRLPHDQFDTTYRVTTWCVDDRAFPVVSITKQTGSSVVLDGHRLLTALHVVLCEHGASAVSLVAPDGRHYEALVRRLWPTKDIAELYVQSLLPGHPARIGTAPRVRDALCLQHAVPEYGSSCGEVLSVNPQRPDSDVVHTAHTEHGNSGGGVYDARGNLIGIVTQLILCLPGFDLSCGGRASSLEGVDL